MSAFKENSWSVASRWLASVLAALCLAVGCLATLADAHAEPAPSASAASSASVVSTDGGTTASPSVAAATTAESADYGWLWTIGGVMVVLLVYVGWRFLLSARRS